MKIQTTKKDLTPIVKKLSKLTPKKSSMTIMTHVAVKFDGETASFIANDGSRTYEVKLPCEGEAGQCTLEGEKLFKSIQAMKDGVITIEDGKIKQSRTNIKLDTLSYDDFPLPDHEKMEDAGLDGATLAYALSQVKHAMADNDTRYFLNGAYIGDDWCVSTDGHRMAYIGVENFSSKCIIPAKTVDHITSMGLTDESKVVVGEGQLMVSSNDETLYTRLIDGKYPDWKKVIPSNITQTVTLDRDEFLTALKQCHIGGDNVRLSSSDDGMSLSNENASAVCQCSNDNDFEIAFHIQYLVDAVNATTETEIEIHLSDDKTPVMVGDSNVVMPVRI